MVEVFDCGEVDAERMFLASVGSAGVDQPHQAELTNLGESTETGGIDQTAYARSEWYVDAGGNADAADGGVRAGELRNGIERRQKTSGECGVGECGTFALASP